MLPSRNNESVSPNAAGHSLGTDGAAGVTRDVGFRFKVKYRQANGSAQKNYVGMKSATGALTGDTPLNSNSGYIWFYSTTTENNSSPGGWI
jgi:hypothetical protein